MGRHTQIMGILNVTPDSFWPGSRAATVEAALAIATRMAQDGADWIDVGGESTGPGSVDVSLDDELKRVIPVVAALTRELSIPISVDTTKAEVARQAVAAGARMINDVSALRADGAMARVIASSDASLVLMFAKDATPRTSRRDVLYDDVVGHISRFLQERVAEAVSQGIPERRIVLDPGLGWFVGADPQYSYEILRDLERVRALGFPVLVGPSRKSFLAHDGRHPPRPTAERLMPTAAAVAVAAWLGADMVRVHDVEAMTQVVDTIEAVKDPARTALVRGDR